MRKLILSLTALTIMVFVSCKEEVDTSSRYVFKDKTVISYLEGINDYSEYVQLLKTVKISDRPNSSSVYQLLTARGNYTCFAITNEAIHNYLNELVEQGLIDNPSWQAFDVYPNTHKIDSVRKVVVRNSIIDGGDFESLRFTLSTFPTKSGDYFSLVNLGDRKLSLSWPQKSPDSLFINGECLIDLINRDIPVINGVVHQIHKVIAPHDQTCARYLQDILDQKKEGFLLMARVLQECDLLDIFVPERDEAYEEQYLRGEVPDMENYQDKGGGDKSATQGDPNAHTPEHRKYGHTVFAETDDFWRSVGIDPTADDALDKLESWILSNNMYLTGESFITGKEKRNYPEHLLYKWVTYHILPMTIPAGKLVHHCNEVGYNYTSPSKLSIPVCEWYATYGSNRLLRLYESAESRAAQSDGGMGVYINRFPVHNNGLSGDGHEAYCSPDKIGSRVMTHDERCIMVDVEVSNACIYPIDAPLAYTDAVRDNLAKERIRFDLFSMFPEAITNGLRRADSPKGKDQHVYIPQDRVYKYFDNMSILNEETHFIHYNGYRIDWANYCQDEDKAFGRFDIMFTLPPVPKRGTYELRYKVLATGARGIVQVYFGKNPDHLQPAGIPVDMTKGCAASFGESAEWSDLDDAGKDEDAIIEIDHKLRNHGLMKAARHEVNESNKSLTARDDSRQTRHILVRQTLDPSETYYLRFKSVLDSDKKELYLDYFEWCPKEIYDNPAEPEDVW